MTTAVSSAAGTGSGAATCMFPGCGRPARERAGEGGGKPPIYCDLVNPATGKLAHTPLTAARERARRERHDADDQPAGLVAEARPVRPGTARPGCSISSMLAPSSCAPRWPPRSRR